MAASDQNQNDDKEKFIIPEVWRDESEYKRLTPNNKLDYVPLHMDFIKALLETKSIDFIICFVTGWDLYELVRPAKFTPEFMKEVIETHKKYPTQTKIVLKRIDYFRYERLVSAFRKNRYKTVAADVEMVYTPVFKLYNELSNVSQSIARGSMSPETAARVSEVASQALVHLPSMRDIISFMMLVIARDPILYDHAALTALVSAGIAWNVLRLSKRDTKLCIQSSLLHDVERKCSYLLKPADPKVISEGAIREVLGLKEQGAPFHEVAIQTMNQYREMFAGGGIPRGLKGRAEEDAGQGIVKTARICAISCAFSEYMLKRKDKVPLSLEMITELIRKRAPLEFDPQIVEIFLKNLQSNKVFKEAEQKEGALLIDDEE